MSYFTLTPGYSFGANEPITIAKLNALGQPVVSPGSDLFSVFATLKNIFVNGTLLVWQRILNDGNSVNCPLGSKTFLADRWFVRPSGAAITYGQSNLVRPGGLATSSIQLTGAAGATAADVGYRVESFDAANCCNGPLTFSAWVFNGTGAPFTPNLKLTTPNAADNYAASAIQLNQPLQVCQPGTWTQVTCTFDGSTFGNIVIGLEVALTIPTGALGNAAQTCNAQDLQLERGSTATGIEGRIMTFELDLCQRYCLCLRNTILGFASDVSNVQNKGVFTLPTTMRVKPVFEGAASFTDINYNPAAGTPIISGYANNVMMAIANSANNFTVGNQYNIICNLSAEDVSGA